MARMVVVCLRHGDTGAVARKLGAISERLCPDHIRWPAPAMHTGDGIAAALTGRPQGAALSRDSVVIGGGSDARDGSYAACRWTESHLEAETDVVGSRTLWYCHTDESFIVSTSQRAVIALLGDFHMNDEAVLWMLSSGTLGVTGWDKRVRRIGPDCRVILDRRSWAVTVHREPALFQPERRSRAEHRAELVGAVGQSCRALSGLCADGWRLPLSGGVDSRALLLMMVRNGTSPQCLTWGREESLHEPGNDAYVARELAARLGVPHQYSVLTVPKTSIETVAARFISVGEGCVDHISGYVDGFEIWRKLYDSDVPGIIRGDEAFGWKAGHTERQVRFDLGIMLLSDHFEADQLSGWGLRDPVLPEEMVRTPEETLAQWRDRLYQQFRIPVVLAALNDLKCGHVEIVNPLLSRGVISVVRRMPDELRTGKNVFAELVHSMGPPIPFATKPAIESPGDIMGSAHVRSWMQEQLHSSEACRHVPDGFRRKILAKLEAAPATREAPSLMRRFKALAGKTLPSGVAARVKQVLPEQRPVTDWNVVAFRASVVARMARLLGEDSRL